MSMPIHERISQVPIQIAGSNVFGRYPKISASKTFNMFVSDGWLVPTPGHIKIADIDPLSEGRGIFTSIRGQIMVVVIGNGVWIIDKEIEKVGRTIPIDDESEQMARKIGIIGTFIGDVFIDENDAEQIGICDKKDIHIYDYKNGTFSKATIDFKPGYIAFQDGYFIAPDSERPQWRLSALNNGLSWPAGAANVGSLQTKPDNARACVRVPGKGNQLFVMGSTVTEAWNNVGYQLFPYYRGNSFNIDYGCINQATIATSDRFVIWVGVNEKSGPVVMYSEGGPATQISTDGINFALSQLTKPEDSSAFLFKYDGHLFYQATWKTDKVTYLFDFTTQKNYFLTDEKMANHIAKKVTYFFNDYYFISFIDGNLYRLSGESTTYDGNLIPRVRVANTIRMKDGKAFIGRQLGFTIEQGENSSISRIDVSLSYDGGVNFGNSAGYELNDLGRRQNKFNVWDLGCANELTPQFRFWGEGRFVCANGFLEAYQ